MRKKWNSKAESEYKRNKTNEYNEKKHGTIQNKWKEKIDYKWWIDKNTVIVIRNGWKQTYAWKHEIAKINNLEFSHSKTI